MIRVASHVITDNKLRNTEPQTDCKRKLSSVNNKAVRLAAC